MTDVRIELFGGFRVSIGGEAIPDDAWRRRKAAALVKLLALDPRHRLHRERIMDLLWPELPPEPVQAVAEFRVAQLRPTGFDGDGQARLQQDETGQAPRHRRPRARPPAAARRPGSGGLGLHGFTGPRARLRTGNR